METLFLKLDEAHATLPYPPIFMQVTPAGLAVEYLTVAATDLRLTCF